MIGKPPAEKDGDRRQTISGSARNRALIAPRSALAATAIEGSRPRCRAEAASRFARSSRNSCSCSFWFSAVCRLRRQFALGCGRDHTLAQELRSLSGWYRAAEVEALDDGSIRRA